jgi:hypothetical protein
MSGFNVTFKLQGSVALIAGRAEAAVGSYSEVFDVTA